ncbi:MAG: diacylglycerol kinase [Xanthomonadaceae bacterium]|nr:diacylglycerol kinase [Rhodospirillaceae bacterium]NIA18183.1 diacylglycerol kinase [Xanthomonadaceae bacterium]
MFFNFKRAVKSFIYAFRGLKSVWKSEQNFRFHSITAILVLSLALILHIKRIDFIIIILLIGLVLILELVNTIFEKLIDILKPRIHEYSKEIKNISSAVVLLAAFVSVIIGIIIFCPYFEKIIF